MLIFEFFIAIHLSLFLDLTFYLVDSTAMDQDDGAGVRSDEHSCAGHLDPASFGVRGDPQAVHDKVAQNRDSVTAQEGKSVLPSVVEPPIESSSQSCWTWWNRHGLSVILLILLLAVIAILIAELILRKSKTARRSLSRREILWE